MAKRSNKDVNIIETEDSSNVPKPTKKQKKDDIKSKEVKSKEKVQPLKINNIEDLIKLENNSDFKEKYGDKIKNIVPALKKLRKLVGMKDIKSKIVGQIIFFIMGFQDKNNNMMHTVIQGPPGVGKTTLGRIIGEIYYNLNIIQGSDREKSSKKSPMIFKSVKRPDLIGKYLGQTAPKTQAIIDSVIGGVLFIDEAYSLGAKDGADSYSKECLDTLNINLTEKKNEFLCIIAGYKEALDNNFFAFNEGLSRRFPFRYTIEKYTYNELREIFINMIQENGDNWIIDTKIENLDEFFKKNYDFFPNSAGDIETLIFVSKIEHSKRVFALDKSHHKLLNLEDIIAGLENVKKTQVTKKDDTSHLMMYV